MRDQCIQVWKMHKWQGVKNNLRDSWSFSRCYPVSGLVESTRTPHIQFDCIAMPSHVLTCLYNFKDMWRAPAWQRVMQLTLLPNLGWEFLHKWNASILCTSWFPAQQWHSTLAYDLKTHSSRWWRPRTLHCLFSNWEPQISHQSMENACLDEIVLELLHNSIYRFCT